MESTKGRVSLTKWGIAGSLSVRLTVPFEASKKVLSHILLPISHATKWDRGLISPLTPVSTPDIDNAKLGIVSASDASVTHPLFDLLAIARTFAVIDGISGDLTRMNEDNTIMEDMEITGNAFAGMTKYITFSDFSLLLQYLFAYTVASFILGSYDDISKYITSLRYHIHGYKLSFSCF